MKHLLTMQPALTAVVHGQDVQRHLLSEREAGHWLVVGVAPPTALPLLQPMDFAGAHQGVVPQHSGQGNMKSIAINRIYT